MKKGFIKLLFLKILRFFLFLFAPSLANGQIDLNTVPRSQFFNIGVILANILNYVVWPIVITIVIIFFIMAGFKFLMAKGDPNELATARRFLIWAVAGVIVIILSFSIVSTIRITLNV